MISQQELEEALAKLRAEQKTAANEALSPYSSKAARKVAKWEFYTATGKIAGLLAAFGKTS